MINSKNINDLREDFCAACKEVCARAKKEGINIIITSTVRDDEYQATLYAQGRTTKGSIITNAKTPSFHSNKVGLAFDFCPIDEKGKALWNRLDLFTKVGEIAEEMGLEWSGRWKIFPEYAHIQWSGYNKEFKAADVRTGKLPPKFALKGGEKMDAIKDIKQIEEVKENKPHWAEQCYKSLATKGIVFSEKRYDDFATRAEIFAMLDKIVK